MLFYIVFSFSINSHSYPAIKINLRRGSCLQTSIHGRKVNILERSVSYFGFI